MRFVIQKILTVIVFVMIWKPPSHPYYSTSCPHQFHKRHYMIILMNSYPEAFRLTLIGRRSSEISKLKCKYYVSTERKKEKKKREKGKKGGGKALIGQSDQLFRRVNQR